jgi:hypothetical protein
MRLDIRNCDFRDKTNYSLLRVRSVKMRKLCFSPGSLTGYWRTQHGLLGQETRTNQDEGFASIRPGLLRHSGAVQRAVKVQTITPKTRLMKQADQAENFSARMA